MMHLRIIIHLDSHAFEIIKDIIFKITVIIAVYELIYIFSTAGITVITFLASNRTRIPVIS